MTTTHSADIHTGAALDSGSQSIRVLYLHLMGDGEPVKTTLGVVSLDQAPEFEALSYVWGDGALKQTILIDGARYQVTDALYVALANLRNLDSQRVLWVDAICINQDDTAERNHQVQMMRRIYSAAVRVIAWLGPWSTASVRAFDFMAKL